MFVSVSILYYDAPYMNDTHDLETPIANLKADEKDKGFWGFTVIAIIVLLLLRLFVFGPFLVFGSSMEPTFDTGDYLIVDELSYRLHDPARGDVIVLTPPIAGDENTHFIKRIIGLPGETIIVHGSNVIIKNKQHPDGFQLTEPYVKFPSDRVATYILTSDQYFVMGDNRAVSSDSRIWGPLKRSLITGRAFFRLYPFNKMGIFPGKISFDN